MGRRDLFGGLLLAAGMMAAGAEMPFRAPVESPVEHRPGFIWLEAEGFESYGGWRLDTQFTHKMGSAYLIAAGVLKPLEAAHTTLRIPRTGTWRVWARTKDWLPEYSPGTFAVAVDGQRGPVLGASGKEGWRWEEAGQFTLRAGPVTVALCDLSGAFARCDALLFTTDLDYRPDDTEETRRVFRGEPAAIQDGGQFELIVVGAGSGGLGTAIAAARTGARVALIHDRPVLGGNSSTELGVSVNGAAVHRTGDRRETGICEEAMMRRWLLPSRSAAYREMVDAEKPRLTEFPNQRVLSVEKEGDRITAVIARNTLTGARTRYRATLFADCTGDGWIGYFAGAERMYGREAKSEYDEWPAPESRDELTMSGCIMDNGAVGYRYALRSEPKPYTVPEWARVLPEGFTRRIHRLNSEWWVEHGGRFDDLADPERARDELVRIEFAYWGWIKNESPMREKAANAELVSMAYMNARREGFRLTGDYILTANDALQGRLFPDRISYGGWPLDTHDPLGMENPTGNGYWKHHPNVPPYSIPYRCLYSKNIANLLVAGRCQSVTHIALGSVRVQATLFTLGQAAGTAAALMLQKGLLPREYGQRHIAELQQRLLKDDQYIPSLRNGDPLDFTRKARVISTSAQRVRTIDRNDRGLYTADMPPHALDGHRRATSFARGLLERLDAVELPLLSESQTPVTLTAKLYLADTAASIEEGWKPVALLKGTVPPASDGFVRFVPERPVPLTGAYVWIELPKAKGIAWRLRAEPTGEGHFRAYCADRVWTPVYGQQYAFVTEPALRLPVETHPEAVIDGVSRPENGEYHGWRSDPALPLPQAIRLDFPEAVTASEVRLTFDTNLSFWETINRPPRLVKRYRVEALTAGSWTTLVEERDNRLRHRIHTFPKREMTALRVTVLETYGDPSARIFEIRVYDN